MVAWAIICGGVALTLISPLIAALLLSATFFINIPIPYLEKITYRLVRLFFIFSFCCSVIALTLWCCAYSPYGAVDFGRIRLMKDLMLNLRLVFDLYSMVFLATLSSPPASRTCRRNWVMGPTLMPLKSARMPIWALPTRSSRSWTIFAFFSICGFSTP